MQIAAMSPEALVYGLVWSHSMKSLLALALGFAVAGSTATGYQALTLQPVSVNLLEQAQRRHALTAVPFVVFAAPVLIVRYTLQSAHPKQGNFGFAMIAAVLASFWSLMSGTLVISVLEAAGRLVA